MTGKLSEKILLYKLETKKDPEAFALLYDKYVQRIYRFIYFKISNHEETEDVASEVFLKAWNYIINCERGEIKSFSGLLYKIARNCIIDVYRSRSLQQVELPLSSELEIKGGEEWRGAVDNKLETQEIIQALKKLKQEYQEVITLRYVEELEIEEIAEIIGKSGIAVRVTLHRALKKLKEIMSLCPGS